MSTEEDSTMAKKWIETIYPSLKPGEVIGLWEDFLRFEYKTFTRESLIVAGPSAIIGLLITDKLKAVTEFEDYSVIRDFHKMKKEMQNTSVFYFDGYFFNLRILVDCCNKLFKDNDILEMRLVQSQGTTALTIKIDDRYSFGIAEMVDDLKEFVIGPNKVTYWDSELDDDGEFVRTGKKAVSEMKNGVAIFKIDWGSRSWNKYLIDKSYFFELQEEEGDFCAI